MIRRLLAFAFRHDFRPAGKARLKGRDLVDTMTCSRCGLSREWTVGDREQFHELYTMRGCRGEPRGAVLGDVGHV